MSEIKRPLDVSSEIKRPLDVSSDIKRPLDVSSDIKRPLDVSSELSLDGKKQHTKPGRKRIETEPKSKRTAQNRAAQRAYRERKERKMKDLEEKVASLEDDKMQAEAQIQLLRSELSRYTGQAGLPDLKLPIVRVKPESSDDTMPQSAFPMSFPWAKPRSLALDTRSNASSHLQDLTSGSSSANSPFLENIINTPSNSSVLSNPTSETLGGVGASGGVRASAGLGASGGLGALTGSGSLHGLSRHNTASLFEEELDPFCSSLNEACGTRSKPVPKFHRDSQFFPSNQQINAPMVPPPTTSSPFHTLFVPTESEDSVFNNTESTFNFNLNDPFAKENPLAMFDDVNFDVHFALGDINNDLTQDPLQENDSLAGLVSEESAYDPLMQANSDFNFNEFVKDSYTTSDMSRVSSLVEPGIKPESTITSFNSPPILKEEETREYDEVVPAPAQTLKCSEIWDRITSHPRYTEIDIDGLCSELKAKAKCSEKGVVLNADDVSTLLEKSARNRA